MKVYCGKNHEEEIIVPDIRVDDLKALDDAYIEKISQLDLHKTINSDDRINAKSGNKMSKLESIGEYLMRCLSR